MNDRDDPKERSEHTDTTTEAGTRVVETLAAHGIEYLFSTFGTDHPPIIKGLAEHGEPTPILLSDEMVAASAAHGYAQATGRPGAVLVHVDVGTTNLGPSLHNAARSRVPLFLMAGKTPVTTREERPGTRSIFVHYYQDVFDQHGLVREYTKWEYDLEAVDNVEDVLTRGIQRAIESPSGPVYLTMSRERLRETTDQPLDDEATIPVARSPTVPTETAVSEVATLIDESTFPILITSYLGRQETAVDVLRSFAETLGVGVIEAAPAFDLNFPRNHPLHLGFDAETYFDEADLVFVVDCDVPWVPSRGTPSDETTVVQLDEAPEKSQYPLWDFRIDRRLAASVEPTLELLTQACSPRRERRARLEEAAARREERHSEGSDRAATDGISPSTCSSTLGELLSPDDIVVDETVSNTVTVLEQLERTEPGSYYSYCSSGLGWATGAALGVKLARPDHRVVSLVGDSSFVFGNPVGTIHAARSYDLPTMTVIYNNAGWGAVRNAIRDQYPTPEFDIEPYAGIDAPDFAGMAHGMGCFGKRVEDPQRLAETFDDGLAAIESGTPAVIDVALTEG